MKQRLKVSKPKVLRSAAGYYIGTLYRDLEDGDQGPYERLSGYFKDRETADNHLPSYL